MSFHTFRTVGWWVLALAAAALPYIGISSRWIQFVALIGINTLLAQRTNIIGGYAGQLSLGLAGLFAAGAYGTSALAIKLGWPVWASIPVAVVIAMAVGILVAPPAERVRKFYLGMVTLASGVIALEILQYWTPVTGGFSSIARCIAARKCSSPRVAVFADRVHANCRGPGSRRGGGRDSRVCVVSGFRNSFAISK